MKENDIDTSVDNEEVVETEVESSEEAAETAEPQEESAQELKARLQRAEKKIEKMKLDAKVEKKVEQKVQEKNTGDLDETQLDYLDLKGISEDEDVKVIQDIVKKTGMTVRQAFKDDYVTSKLEANKNAREVKAATPSSTKRAGNQSDGFDTALARFEKDGTLPDDFELRKKVVNAKYRAERGNQPSWHT